VKTRLVAAAAALAVLAACTSAAAPAVGLGFAEPSAIAFFRGVTVKSGLSANPADPYPYRPYFAVANSASNDLTIIDGADDTSLPAPEPLHALTYAVPGRPLLLAGADLGDKKPDLLVVVTAGDLPWLGGTRLQVIRTWATDGAVVGAVDLGLAVIALAPLPPDPAAPGTARLVAALADERIAVVSFPRSAAGDGTAIDVAAAQFVVSAPLGFQPIDLAVLPGDRTRVFAASRETLPGGVIQGVAEISLAGTQPVFVPPGLNALAPTRVVAAAHLAEADLLRTLSSPNATALDPTAFVDATTSLARPTVDRIYAVLDESGCGLLHQIGCGVVAIDPVTRALAPDPTPAGSMQAPYRAPLPLGFATAMAAFSGPPSKPPPDLADPQNASTFLRIAVNPGNRASTGAAAVTTLDGALNFVDLGRWDLPSQQLVVPNVKATVTPTRAPGTSGLQWLVLERPGGGTVSHVDTVGLVAAVTTTPGYTPTDRWAVVRQGILPGLSGLRAEAGSQSGTPWLALQQTDPANGSAHGAVRLYDPTLGVRVGDTVVIEPTGLGTCTTFEATVSDVGQPDATRPGGFVLLAPRVIQPDETAPTAATRAMWDQCVAELATAAVPGRAPFFSATFRAGRYVLLRGNPPSVHVGRPEIGVPFQVIWQDENASATGCLLPPAVPWPAPPLDPVADVPLCDAACRDTCQLLQQVRLARRVGYLVEAPANAAGPAVGFTIALEVPTVTVPRDLAITMDTVDGRAAFRIGPNTGIPADPRAAVVFDRSPWDPSSGIRFLSPYAGGVVFDAGPSAAQGTPVTLH
jgi:hypothetical protein